MTTFKDDPEQRSPIVDGEEANQRASDFAAHARRLLLESIDHLDGGTRSRLTQARYAALTQLEARKTYGLPGAGRWLLPAGGLAAVAAAIVWLGARGVDAPVQTAAVNMTSPLDDMEIMGGAENLELLEDLEFYAWLDAEAALLPLSGSEAG